MALVKDTPHPFKTMNRLQSAWIQDEHHEPAHWSSDWDAAVSPIDSPHIIATYSQGLAGIVADWPFGENIVSLQGRKTESTESLRHRLDSANKHFRRKAADVLGDENAVVLLADLYQSSSVRIKDFDACQHGIALAKLAAANFCEVGANLIYITEAGQSFIESINQ